MIVFIFGGEKQHYLTTQVECIRQNLVGVKDVVYVSGPLSRNPLTSASRTHVTPCMELTHLNLDSKEVRPGLKHFRIRAIINHIAETYLNNDYGLFLHGDTFPIATMDSRLLRDHHLSAKCRGHAVQWCLTRQGIGHKMLETRNVRVWGMGTVKLGDFNCQSFAPGFIHLDDYSTDDDETCQKKLSAFIAAYPIPLS